MSRLDARRQRLLAAMGITAWQPRVSEQERAASALMIVAGAPQVETGPTGELLNNMRLALGAQHQQHVVLSAAESDTAQEKTRLAQEIKRIQPAMVLALGQSAAQILTGNNLDELEALRGRWHAFDATATPVYVSFHPADLLADPRVKAKAWEDLLAVQSALPEAA